MNIELYHGDCLIEMQKIKDKSVDCILTDPPYAIDFQSNRRPKEYRFKKILNDKEPFIKFIKELPRVLKNSGCIFMFTRWDKQQYFIDELERNNLKVKNVLIWDKVIHGMGDLTGAFGSRYESIIFVSMENFTFPNKRYTDIIEYQRVDPVKLLHPNQKPVELLEELLKMVTVENDVVLDLFMGSGSSGVACKNTGRHFIGIEQDKKYFDIAKARINDVIIRKVGSNIEITNMKVNKSSIEDFL